MDYKDFPDIDLKGFLIFFCSSLFDDDYKKIFKEYAYFDEIKDADSDPCDNLRDAGKLD